MMYLFLLSSSSSPIHPPLFVHLPFFFFLLFLPLLLSPPSLSPFPLLVIIIIIINAISKDILTGEILT